MKNVNSEDELDRNGIYFIWKQAGHGVDFATEYFLMEQCEMMTTSALTIAEAHHFNAVQYLFGYLKLLNQLNVTYFNIQ